ncbi:MAG: hypothetical protein CBR30_02690 [Dictyoglomus sp. NZ13-RE01]|nr:MAG: hypothetical protein CBR30_02690 [Dictyoglomus sp. NZ13-RE01]
MKFPKGETIYKETPSELLNLKELIAWIRSKKFYGILRGIVSEYETEILITNGKLRKAFTYHQGELILSDEDAINMFVTDALARNSKISLCSLDSKITKVLLVSLFTSPKIHDKEISLFVPSKLLEDCIKKNTISQLSILFSKDKYHFLFEGGELLGYYEEGEGMLKLDPEYKVFNELLNRGEGFLRFYQITEEDFENLKLPSLKFGVIEEEMDKIYDVLLSYMNFLLDFYSQHGLSNGTIEGYIKNTNPFGESLVFYNKKFILKEIHEIGWNEFVEYFVSFIKMLNVEIAKYWGKKVTVQKYQQVYKTFFEKYKNEPEILKILEDLSPEKLEFEEGDHE